MGRQPGGARNCRRTIVVGARSGEWMDGRMDAGTKACMRDHNIKADWRNSLGSFSLSVFHLLPSNMPFYYLVPMDGRMDGWAHGNHASICRAAHNLLPRVYKNSAVSKTRNTALSRSAPKTSRTSVFPRGQIPRRRETMELGFLQENEADWLFTGRVICFGNEFCGRWDSLGVRTATSTNITRGKVAQFPGRLSHLKLRCLRRWPWDSPDWNSGGHFSLIN